MLRMKRILFAWAMMLCGCMLVQAQTALPVTLSTGARMDVYRVPNAQPANGRAVLICPGGGYEYLAKESEGTDWVLYFRNQGYVVIVLSYRMPNGVADAPLEDAKAAMLAIREKGTKWRIENGCVGVMGFSAGGHVASTLATHADVESGARPDFQILFYPVITMNPSYTHMGSHDNLLGANATEELEALYSNELHVNAQTPRAFITYAANDGTVSPDNSKNYYNALTENNVEAYIKEYPTGGHGFGFKTSFAYHDDVLQELSTWLTGLDEEFPNAVEAPKMEKATSGKIYRMDGTGMGASWQALPSGVYICDGVKRAK
jgi:acetyl esterase/lipase